MTDTAADWREELAKLQRLVHGGDQEERVDDGNATATEVALGLLENSSTFDLPADVTSTVTTLYIRLLLQQAEEDASFDAPLNYIRNKVHTPNGGNFYAAEEAYCLYRKKQYAKAKTVCEKVLNLDSNGNNNDIASLKLPSTSTVASPEGVLHVYAQTLYRLGEFPKAQQVYSALQSQQANGTSSVAVDEAEVMTNAVAAAACTPGYGTQVLGELERTASKEVAAMMKGKQRLADIYSDNAGDSDNNIPYDLAYNVATAMAVHGSSTQDLQTAASLLMQAQQACKASLEAEEETVDAAELQAELAPLQCNQAYALLKQSLLDMENGSAEDAQKKKRLAEAFLNKVTSKSKSGSAAAIVAAHNAALIKALSAASGSGKGNNTNKSSTKAIEEALKAIPDPLASTSSKLSQAQVMQMLQNIAIMVLQHGHKDADCLAILIDMR